MTELQKMVSGKLYDSTDAELRHISAIAHGLCLKYNNTFEEEIQKRQEIIDELIPNKGTGVYLQGPIYFDYGCFTILGNNFYANFNLTVLDSCPVKIGDNVMIGPNCSLLTAVHPIVTRIGICALKRTALFLIMNMPSPSPSAATAGWAATSRLLAA